MKNRTPKTAGRPETKASLRNFKFRKDIDLFLSEEAGKNSSTGQMGRTGKTATLYIEQSLALLMKMKPAQRDALMAKALAEKEAA